MEDKPNGQDTFLNDESIAMELQGVVGVGSTTVSFLPNLVVPQRVNTEN
jgi:hypothetical protein